MLDISAGIGPKTNFKYSKFFLSGCGIWPYQSPINKKCFRYLWITQQIIITVTEMIKLIEIRRDTDLLIEALPPILYSRLSDVKLINGIVNQDKMKRLLAEIEKYWNNLSDEAEIQILSRYAGTGKLINLMYICIVYSAILSCMFLPLTPIIQDMINPLNQSRPLQTLFMVEFFVDEQKYFLTILMHNYITALLSAVPLVAMDTFYMNCIYHVCGMITILGTRLDNVIINKPPKKSSREDKYKQLCNCIDMHQQIFDFCDGINNTYSTSFFILLFISMSLMSFTGVVVVIKLDDFSQLNDTIRFAVFTSAQVFHLFCFNFMGQNLLNSMEELGDILYSTAWYEMSIKIQGLIKLMILRNLKPMIMQALLFPLCLPIFTSVMKTSMSYFTVIKSTR